MKTLELLRGLPLLLPLLTGCGDDVGSSGDSATGGQTGSSAPTDSGVPQDSATSMVFPDTSGLDSASVDSGSRTATGNPAAVDDTVFVGQNKVLALGAAQGVLVNDDDPKGGGLSVSESSTMSTEGGIVVVSSDGGVNYTPPPGYWGTDSFEYTAQDEAGDSSAATVSVHVAPAAIDLAEVTAGRGGFALNGEQAHDESGFSVSGAGDVNGDGLGDLIVGAHRADHNGASSGRSYVVFGKANNNAVELGALGTDGFVLGGETEHDRAGESVSGTGDVNGDGLADLIIGAPLAGPAGGQSGRSYVVFGTANTAAVELGAMDAGGFALIGENQDDQSGYSVSGAGDVNGDGLADLIVGAPFAEPNGERSGRSHVVFGKADTTAVELGAPGTTGGFVLSGETQYEMAGRSVSGAGDVNGDGLADLIIGAPNADANAERSGRIYVVFGKADIGAVALGALGTGGFVLDGEAFADLAGYAVGGAGDVNGDGLDDLIIGAFQADANGDNSGRSYVVFGRADAGAVNLEALGTGGFVVNGEVAWDRAGQSVSGAGDVNGDGLADLIIGAPNAGPNGTQSGRSYVVFGKTGTGAVDLGALGAAGFVLDGETDYDYSGNSVHDAGDVNGDGFADLIIGASGADPNGIDSGRSYVVFGVPTADTCCNSHALPGCTDAVIQQCVCDTQASCCGTAWDSSCVEAAAVCGTCG